jgi:hypothetical protein
LTVAIGGAPLAASFFGAASFFAGSLVGSWATATSGSPAARRREFASSFASFLFLQSLRGDGQRVDGDCASSSPIA